MTLKSQLLFTMRTTLTEPTEAIGATARGYRVIAEVAEGRFEGPRLSGVVVPGGRDWALLRADGVMEVDVRMTLRTDDAALIYVSYAGLVRKGKKAFALRAQGLTPDPDEIYFRTTPRFETGAERYAWLNTVVAVGLGELPPGEVRYAVHEIL